MELLLLVVRLCLFAALFYGFLRCVNRVFCVPAAFVPILGVSCLSTVLVLLGILNLLLFGVLAFVCLGVYGFVKYPVWRDRFRVLRNPAILLFIAACAFYFIYFYGRYLNTTDDFTHWACVVRVLLRYNRLPRFTDAIIHFPSYPAGSSVFVYLVCRILGSQTDGAMMFAQMILLVSCILPLSALIKKRPVISGLLILLTAAFSFLCVAEAAIWSLLVDILLPLTCVAGYVILYRYRETIDEKWFVLLPVLAFISMIKNSGIFFFAVLILQAGIYLFRCPRLTKKQRWVRLFTLAAVPLTMLLLWGQHADLVFEGGLVTRHSLSPIYMYNTFFNKASGTNAETIRSFFATLGDISVMRQAVSVFALAFLCVLTGRVFRIRSAYKPGALLLTLAAVYIAYLLGLLGMYLFNAPEGTLASFSRYENTVHILLVGVIAVYVIELINAAPAAPARAAVLPAVCTLALFGALLAVNRVNLGNLVVYPVANQQATKTFAERVPDHNKETRYLVYVYDGYKWFNFYNLIATYYLYPAQCETVNSSDLAPLENWTDRYDYLIAFSPDDAYRAYAASRGVDPEQYIWSRDTFLTAVSPS